MIQLLKAVTLNKSVYRAMIFIVQVTKVTVKVTVKPIDIDIIYNIVTLVTCKLIHTYARARAHTQDLVFSGNQGNQRVNQYVEALKSVTLTVTLVTLNIQSYLNFYEKPCFFWLPKGEYYYE